LRVVKYMLFPAYLHNFIALKLAFVSMWHSRPPRGTLSQFFMPYFGAPSTSGLGTIPLTPALPPSRRPWPKATIRKHKSTGARMPAFLTKSSRLEIETKRQGTSQRRQNVSYKIGEKLLIVLYSRYNFQGLYTYIDMSNQIRILLADKFTITKKPWRFCKTSLINKFIQISTFTFPMKGTEMTPRGQNTPRLHYAQFLVNEFFVSLVMIYLSKEVLTRNNRTSIICQKKYFSSTMRSSPDEKQNCQTIHSDNSILPNITLGNR
ncbi:Hypothetical predicted protein, partial [Paramuricea clavata]